MTTKDVQSWIVLLIMFFIYLKRHQKPYDKLWYIIKMFFIILFATLMANYAKKSLKEWWRKD
jgi:hypothetical protein